MEANAANYRLEEHDRRLSGHHKRIGAIEVKNSDQDKALVGLEHDVHDLDQKVSRIEVAIEKSDGKRDASEERTRKALYTFAAFFATLSVSIMGLIAVLLQSHG